MNDKRFEAPQIVQDNMAQGRNGLREGKGFFDYNDMDVPAYRRDRLSEFLRMLQQAGLARPPVL
jgi:3-hydroxybutyryl-CoA dehydrogenase